MRKGAQEELIEERLKLQEAKKNGIEVTDDEVRRVLKGLAGEQQNDRGAVRPAPEGAGRGCHHAEGAVSGHDRLAGGHLAVVSRPSFRSPSVRSTGPISASGGGRRRRCRVARAEDHPVDADGLRPGRHGETVRRSGGVAAQVRRLQDHGGPYQGRPGLKFEDMKFIKPSSISEPTRSLLLSAKDGDMLPPSAMPGAIDLMAVCARRSVKSRRKAARKGARGPAGQGIRDARQAPLARYQTGCPHRIQMRRGGAGSGAGAEPGVWRLSAARRDHG